MEYLKSVLGIQAVHVDGDYPSFPNYINARYRLEHVVIEGIKTVFIYPKTEMDAVNAVKKHIERIEKETGATAVLIPGRLTTRQKEYLLGEHIPFIVEGRQIYLPFMALYLQERCDAEKREDQDLLPSTQLLLLYYIYQGCSELLTSDACRALSFTATSISRACRQLEDSGLIQTERRGVQKVIISDREPKALFEEAKDYLKNPVKRTIYVSKSDIEENMLLSGYSALSGYSTLNPPETVCYATGSIASLERRATVRLQNADDQCAVELWRYAPEKLTAVAGSSKENSVDRLSLALALDNIEDERTEATVNEMLDDLWREMNYHSHAVTSSSYGNGI